MVQQNQTDRDYTQNEAHQKHGLFKQAFVSRHVVLCACRQNGTAVQYASSELQGDKEVVLHAASQHPDALKYAQGNVNQNPDCLKAAKVWDFS
jgi:inactivated superfamily I helicase